MIIDEVVWNVIKNKHCSFRMKYFLVHSEQSPKIFAETSTTLQVFATGNHVLSLILNMLLFASKKESAISI